MSKDYTLNILRDEIIHLMVKVLFWFSLPLTLYSWSRILKVGFLPVMALHGILLLTIFITLIKRKNLKATTQANVIVLVFLGIALGGVPTRAALIYGIPGGIFAIAFAAILFNKKIAFRYLAFEVLLVLSLGLYFGDPKARFQSIFELVAYTVFQFFLILSLDKIRESLTLTISELNDALEAKGRFLATMSHEIRTPIHGITLAAENLKEEKEDEAREEMADIIVNSSKHLKGIIDDILDYSKLENQKVKVKPELIALHSFLKRIKRDFENQAETLGLDFEVNVEPQLEYIFSDPFRLEQILRNLLTNAFKFTSKGTITVSFALSEDKKEACLNVSDTGVGIELGRQESIFEEFEQETLKVARDYGGTGLGLAIVKGLGEVLGGRVVLDSAVGVGSSFKVYLPYDENQIKELLKTIVKNRGLEKKRAECTGDRKSKLLIVEDNDINIKVFTKRLSNLGFENVFIAKNGEVALDMLRNEKIDLIFMDIQMPVMDGLEATKAIREGKAGESAKGLPIVGLSANSFEEDMKAGKDAGMNDYIGKPLSVESLIEVLNRYL